MTKNEQKQIFLTLLRKVDASRSKDEMAGILSQIITEVGKIKYELEDMPLVTGALNLLVSSVALDYNEGEKVDYTYNTALKTLVDMAVG